MTFGEILNAAYDDQGYQISGAISPNPSADVIARFKRWANEGYRTLFGHPRLAALRHGTFPFTSVSGQGIYFVAEAFDAIDAIVQPTNDRRLRNMTRDWFRSIDPGERSEGTPWAWIEEGYSPVARQPVVSPLWVKSTSPLDVTQVVTVLGASNSAGYDLLAGHATLNGTTPVQVDASAAWGPLRSLYLSAPAIGDVGIADAAIPTKLYAIIQRTTTSTQYHQIRLWPTPSASEAFIVDGQLRVRDLIDPNDVPFQIPALYHSVLVDWINFNAWTKNGDFTRAAMARTNYERRVGELVNKTEFSADYRPVRGGAAQRMGGWTNLPGGWYPSDFGRW